MGPTKRNMQQEPSLADRIKASNNTPLEPTKRSSNETKQVNRDRLVRNFIRLYCRELAIRPLVIQAVAEARATNLEIINLYGHTEQTSKGNATSKSDEIEHNETIFLNKGGKSNKQSTRRLNDIDNIGKTLADLVNGLTIQSKQGCLDLINETDDECHKANVLIAPDKSSKTFNKSLNLNAITRQTLEGTESEAGNTNSLIVNLDKPLIHDSTNLVINDKIYLRANQIKSCIDNSDTCVSDLLHTNIIEQSGDSFENKSRISSISSKSKRRLVPRYKAVRVLNTRDGNSDNKTSYSNPVDNRPISSSSTVTMLPSSETEEGVTYTTEEITSSSQASPDIVRKMTDSPVPALENAVHQSRALSFPESNGSNKFPGVLYRKQDILTENYFSDTPMSRSTKANQINQRVYPNKFNKTDINSNRNRIDQVIDSQTRKTLVQNQLKKFGVAGNPRGSQKNSASLDTSNIHINTNTALNDGFLTMSNQYSPKCDPFHEFPKKQGWFLKSGELEYDERFTFEDKRQTKSKAYMQVQRQHYKRRTMDVVPQNINRETKTESVRGKRHDLYASGKYLYNQEPRMPLITKRLRFRKGMGMTKPLQKRKPFITVV